MPNAVNEIDFQVNGPAKIIGVGNGNPTSLEADQFIEQIEVIKITHLEEKAIAV